MLEHRKPEHLQDYFRKLSERKQKGIYFCRLNGYNEEIDNFIEQYYEKARQSGAVIEGRIPNPDEKNLAYYGEIMGSAYRLDRDFISQSLKKWLPRMGEYQRKAVAGAIYDTLDDMKRKGKNENIQKNAYIKFMCWLYYKFERVTEQLGQEEVPKILYEGDISNYELKLILVLAGAGCDVVLLQYKGDAAYRKLDPESEYSYAYQAASERPFPPEYCIKFMRDRKASRQNRERLYGPKSSYAGCVNAWATGKEYEDLTRAPAVRGNDKNCFYNCFYRLRGVEDKTIYANRLYRLWLDLKNAGRKTVIVEGEIKAPSTEEIAQIRRDNYDRFDRMIAALEVNLPNFSDFELQKLVKKAFVDTLAGEQEAAGGNLNKLNNRAVYLLCWLKRFQSDLFSGLKLPEVSCFIHLGGCKNGNEAMFLKFLAKLPVDVVILVPDLNDSCCLTDPMLLEKKYEQSHHMEHYPTEDTQVLMGTAAYHAERDLDQMMYQDSGIYRNQQYGRATSVTLRTMFEEIPILWDEEMKYRPNFSVVDSVVNIPVIYSKISGVKDGDVNAYWNFIRPLVTEDTILVKQAPYIAENAPNPMKSYAIQFYKNGRLQREKIKNHKDYPYAYLREEIQEYILDKLQLLIQQKLIQGIGENGMEYTVIATVLNLNKDILRLLQKFDFTKKNPKLLYINTTETMISLEDSIVCAFLNLVGFDVIFFVPTGYRNVEKYFNKIVMEEHQIGEYKYDLTVPDLKSSNNRRFWQINFFKRGN